MADNLVKQCLYASSKAPSVTSPPCIWATGIPKLKQGYQNLGLQTYRLKLPLYRAVMFSNNCGIFYCPGNRRSKSVHLDFENKI